MLTIRRCLTLVALVLSLTLVELASAQDPLSNHVKVLAEIPFMHGKLGRNAYRRVDGLVPLLKKLSKDKIIMLECHYSGSFEHESNVLTAYQTASSIEKYLREKHGLKLDLWITASPFSIQTKSQSILTIAVFADEIKNMVYSPVEPLIEGQR